jgi:cysteine desulfurase/selenocysteine lyase
VPANTAGFISSASEGLNLLGNSLDWKKGDEILFTDLEHPTNVLPWLNIRRLGVHSILVPSREGTLSLDDFAARISDRTRLVSVSQVSYKNGCRMRFLPDLARAAHRVGALLCVDATQALGRVPADIADADFMVASGYKWLCGIHGSGVIYVRPALLANFQPGSLGWYSVDDAFTPDRFNSYSLKPGAARLQPGMPNFPAMFTLNQAIRYLNQIGIGNIESSLRPLMRRLYQGLSELGLSILTPPEEDLWSGIVSFATTEAETIGSLLSEKGIVTWYGDGRVRASIHLYNDGEDIELFLDALRKILRDLS